MGIFSTIGNVINTNNTNKINKEIADQNMQLQRENQQFQRSQFDWQKENAQKIMDREDNAVQRRAADYEKAGFNRLMGIEGAATGGGQVTPTQSTAPQNQYQHQQAQMDFGEGDIASQVMNAITMKQQLNNSKATERLTNQQANNEAIKAEGIIQDNLLKAKQNTTESKKQKEIDQQIEESKERQRNIAKRTETDDYNLKSSQYSGQRTTDVRPSTLTGAMLKEMYNIAGWTEKIIKSASKKIAEVINSNKTNEQQKTEIEKILKEEEDQSKDKNPRNDKYRRY